MRKQKEISLVALSYLNSILDLAKKLKLGIIVIFGTKIIVFQKLSKPQEMASELKLACCNVLQFVILLCIMHK